MGSLGEHCWSRCLSRATGGFQDGASGKEPARQFGRHKRHGFDPWVGKIPLLPWRRKWQPTPVFFPEESHGQRSFMDYSPWGHKRVRYDLVTEQQIILFNLEKPL